MRLRQLPVLLGLFMAPFAYGQDAIYVGIGVANFDYKENIPNVLITGVEDTAAAYKLFGGFQLNRYLAMEISLGQTNDLVFATVRDFPDLGEVDYLIVNEFQISTFRGLGQLPTDWGALFAGLGFFSSDNSFSEVIDTECCGVLAGDGDFRDDGLTASLGAEWRFGRFGTRYGVRLEYEWWDTNSVDTTALGLAFSYGF